MTECRFQGLWVFPFSYDSLLFTPLRLHPSWRSCPKNKTTRGYRPLSFQAPTLVSCRESQIAGSLPRSSPGGADSAAAGFSRCRVTSPAEEPPSLRSQPRSAAAAAVPQSLRNPQEKQGDGRVGRQTAVVEGETLTRPDNNRRGGEDGGRDPGSAEKPPEASGTLRLLGTPRPLLLLAADFLPSSVLIRLTTSL